MNYMRLRILLTFTLLIAVCPFCMAGVGDTFTASVSGYDMTFKITSETEVCVGTGNNNGYCITINATGTITIPSTVSNPKDGKSYRVTRVNQYAFYGCEQITSVIVPNGVTSIGLLAFDRCKTLSNVTLPSTLVTIEREAFGSTALTSLALPASLVNCEEAFSGAKQLATITVASGNAVLSVQNGILYKTDGGEKTLIHYPSPKTATSFTVPSGVTAIGKRAFSGQTYLKSVSLKDGVKTIDEYAFFWCTALTKCKLPASLTTIKEYAFYHSALQSIHIPEHVTFIGKNAFRLCDQLKTVGIFNRTLATYQTFYATSGTCSSAFEGIHSDAKLLVHMDYDTDYRSSPWISWFASMERCVPIDNDHFDNGLRIRVTDFDTNGDGYLSESELAAVKKISFYNYNYDLTDLKGIQYFTELEELNCAENTSLETIDLSGNTKLKILDVGNCNLQRWLDLSMCKDLEELSCLDNECLTEIGIWNCPKLKMLSCSNCSLKALDLSRNPLLKWLSCEWNEIESLNLGSSTELETLLCHTNKLTSLDVSACTQLKELQCFQNRIGNDAMTALVSGLPNRNGKEKGLFFVYWDDDDENVCSKANAAAAKAMNWQVISYGEEEYEGCDLTDITTSISEAMSQDEVQNSKFKDQNNERYTLSGQRVDKNYRGIVIINGRKVRMK